MRRKPLFVLCGLLVSAALAACGTPATPPEPQASRAPSPSIASVLPELSSFVERARGLEFREDVKVRVLSEALFREQLKKVAPDAEEVIRAQTVLTILGLLPTGGDLATLLAASDQVTVGFYEPIAKELVTVNELTPFVRRVLVHELTHALDDQHFGTGREFESDEAAAAFQALTEGSAVRVERLYVDSLPEAEQQQIEAEERQIREGTAPIPTAVEGLLAFPYIFGPPFVEALLKEGPERLDEAFSSPPASTEQVLDPARYLSGDAPQEVRPPRTEGAVTDEGEIGSVVLRLLLQSKMELAVAGEAATGWDGDRYATWRSPDGRNCIRVQFAVDTPEDRRQLESALAQWVERTTDREVDSAGLLLKACEPRN